MCIVVQLHWPGGASMYPHIVTVLSPTLAICPKRMGSVQPFCRIRQASARRTDTRTTERTTPAAIGHIYASDAA